MLQCPYCEEDAETCGHWDSFDDCRFYLGKIAPMISDLKARIAELESRLEITNGEPANKIDCMAETIKIQDANVDRLRATVSEQQDIIFAMRATVERLRVIELPEITQDIEKKLWTELIDCTDCDCTALEWSQTAKDFVALLNEGRKV